MWLYRQLGDGMPAYLSTDHDVALPSIFRFNTGPKFLKKSVAYVHVINAVTPGFALSDDIWPVDYQWCVSMRIC